MVARGRSVRNPVDATKAGVGYLHGDRSVATIPMWSVGEHLTLPGLVVGDVGSASIGAPSIAPAPAALQQLSVKAKSEDEFASLSGGNQQRALLARWIVNPCEVLVVDEPCVGVDISSRSELLAVISDFSRSAAVVVASSDPADLTAICDRVVCLVRGTVVRELTGDDVTEHIILAAINNEATVLTT